MSTHHQHKGGSGLPPRAALLYQLACFYPELLVEAVAADAELGYYAFLYAIYQLGARRVVDLRANESDKKRAQWPLWGYDDKGRLICPYGYALTANGFDATRRRHRWFCGQARLKWHTPRVQLEEMTYPPPECPYQDVQRPYGQIVNVSESFADGSMSLARDVPLGTSAWKRRYHWARNAVEGRNATLQRWGLKRMPVYGQPRGRAVIALADTWSILTLAIAFRHRALPLARQVLLFGATSAAQQIVLLKQVQSYLPSFPDVHMIFYGDSEFRAVDLQQYCQDQYWHWQVGLTCNTKFCQGASEWQELRAVSVACGQRRYLQGVQPGKKRSFDPVDLTADWTHQDESPHYVATDQRADRHTWRRGRKRFWEARHKQD